MSSLYWKIKNCHQIKIVTYQFQKSLKKRKNSSKLLENRVRSKISNHFGINHSAQFLKFYEQYTLIQHASMVQHVHSTLYMYLYIHVLCIQKKNNVYRSRALSYRTPYSWNEWEQNHPLKSSIANNNDGKRQQCCWGRKRKRKKRENKLYIGRSVVRSVVALKHFHTEIHSTQFRSERVREMLNLMNRSCLYATHNQQTKSKVESILCCLV